METVADRRPLASLVSWVGSDECDPSAFLRSVAAQGNALEQIELVFVVGENAGKSAALLHRWVSDHPQLRVQELACADPMESFHVGIAHANGEWLSFPDFDCQLCDGYLEGVLQFLGSADAQEVCLALTRPLQWTSGGTILSNAHPLDFRFREGTQIVDLLDKPDCVQLGMNNAFFRRSDIQDEPLTPETTVRPSSDDGLFMARYLCNSASKRVAFLSSALFASSKNGWKRYDGMISRLSWETSEKYTTALEHGLLDLLRSAGQPAPTWLQYLTLYYLCLYYIEITRLVSPAAWVKGSLADEFHRIVTELAQLIPTQTIIASPRLIARETTFLAALITGYREEKFSSEEITRGRTDKPRQLTQLRYFFSGELPEEEVRVDGVFVKPQFMKIRDVQLLGRAVTQERIIWVQTGKDIQITFDNKDHKIAKTKTPASRLTMSREPVRPIIAGKNCDFREQSGSLQSKRKVRSWSDFLARALNKLPFVKARYQHSWVIGDRIEEAHDNGEHLYRYLQESRPDINAWFVLSREAKDWERLKSKHFRIAAHKGLRHRLLLLNADHIIMSQTTRPLINPFGRNSVYHRRSAQFVFLQHGVLHDDLSKLVNPAPISLFITSSPAEYDSLVKDHSPYKYTKKEVVLTGMPRHDRLFDLAKNTSDPKILLVAPTWRWALADMGESFGISAFRESNYAQNWFGFLGSKKLRELADEKSIRLVFLPHPKLPLSAAELSQDLPGIEVASWQRDDIQMLLTQSALVVTDYSSLAFDAAYIRRPVMYFQFDFGDFFGGAHTRRRGEWDFEKDGFGPVAFSLEEALEKVAPLISQAGKPESPYLERMGQTFPYHDGNCSQRVVAAIEELSQPIIPKARE